MLRPRQIFAAFRVPAFRNLWLSICLNGFANNAGIVVVSWLALEATGSPLGVGIAIATRNLPRIFLAIPIGVLSDRLDRRKLLQLANAFGAGMALVAGIASMEGWVGFLGLIAISTLTGVLDVAQTTLTKAYVFDVVDRDKAINGMAMEQLANKLLGIVGGVSSGLLLAKFGGSGAFIAMSLAYLLSAAALQLNASGTRQSGAPAATQTPSVAAHPYRQIFRDVLLNRLLLIFVALGLFAEVFAYSSEVLLPSFARDVFHIDEKGLGFLVALLNGGGVLGITVLAAMGRDLRNPERILILVCIGFGVGLAVFAVANSLAVATAVIIIVGAAWATIDTLLPAVMQLRVSDKHRGAAVGAWNLSRGFGPLGQLEIGALAALLGVVATQAINGLAFAAIATVCLLAYRSFESSQKPVD